jgi:hypothetical protein
LSLAVYDGHGIDGHTISQALSKHFYSHLEKNIHHELTEQHKQQEQEQQREQCKYRAQTLFETAWNMSLQIGVIEKQLHAIKNHANIMEKSSLPEEKKAHELIHLISNVIDIYQEAINNFNNSHIPSEHLNIARTHIHQLTLKKQTYERIYVNKPKKAAFFHELEAAAPGALPNEQLPPQNVGWAKERSDVPTKLKR